MLPVTIDLRRNALFIVCDIGSISGVGLERRKLLVSHPAPPMIDGGMSLHKDISLRIHGAASLVLTHRLPMIANRYITENETTFLMICSCGVGRILDSDENFRTTN
jgi:hypothetical protein